MYREEDSTNLSVVDFGSGTKAILYHGLPLMMDGWLPAVDVSEHRGFVSEAAGNLARAARTLQAWLEAADDPQRVKAAAVVQDVMRRFNVTNPAWLADRCRGTSSLREARRAVARELLDAGADIRLVRAVLGGRSRRAVMSLAGAVRVSGRRSGR